MRFLFLVSIVLFVGACGHKAKDQGHHHHHNHEGGHDHSKMEQHKECTSCDHHDKSHKGGECAGCEDKAKCSADCKSGTKERGCCSEGKSCGTKEGATGGAMCGVGELESNQALLQNITQEEFAKLYTKNKSQIGKTCTAPAMEYCGKTTKDLNVTESELSCLWTKVFRVTRERLPQLDGSPCANMIQKFAKK